MNFQSPIQKTAFFIHIFAMGILGFLMIYHTSLIPLLAFATNMFFLFYNMGFVKIFGVGYDNIFENNQGRVWK